MRTACALLACALMACGQPAPAAPDGADSALRTESTMEPSGGVSSGGVSSSGGPIEAALQGFVAGAQNDLARRFGVGADQVEVVEARSVMWPDRGLGCPAPGMLYVQVPEDGLLIRLRYGGRFYEYHSGAGRPPFLCEQPSSGTAGGQPSGAPRGSGGAGSQ
jgi:hypothetical protein